MLTEAEIHTMAAVELDHWWYRGMREIFFDMLGPHVAGARDLRILDVGCGTGGNLIELAKLGDAHGIDLDPLCVEYCTRKGLNCRVADMSNLDALPGSFDLVTMFDALSQAEPRHADAILSEVARVLSRDGLLAFRDTAMRSAGGAHDRAVGVRQRFVRADLTAMLARAGLTVVRTTYLNTLLCPPIVAVRRIRDALRPGDAASDVQAAAAPLNAALLAVLRLERRLLRLTNLPFGVSLFAVARKT